MVRFTHRIITAGPLPAYFLFILIIPEHAKVLHAPQTRFMTRSAASCAIGSLHSEAGSAATDLWQLSAPPGHAFRTPFPPFPPFQSASTPRL